MTKKLLESDWQVYSISRSPCPIKNRNLYHHQINVLDKNFSSELENIPDIELCIYCVGIGESIDFKRLKEIEIFQVNLIGLINTIEKIIPKFISKKEGHFIGISSIADCLINSGAPSYSSSKAAVTSYLRSLSMNLKSKGVIVTNIRLGFVDTKMAKAKNKPFIMTPEKAADLILSTLKSKVPELSAPLAMNCIMRVKSLFQWIKL